MSNIIYMPSHKDAGNRGCEAITRGTAEILKCKSSELVGYCTNINLDKTLGIQKIATLEKARNFDNISQIEKLYRKCRKKLYRDIDKKKEYDYKYLYSDFLKTISSNDIALSTGGDMFCYSNNEVIYINNYLNQKNIKTILWGCSIGKENLSPEKIDTLKKFSLITARETLTKKMLEEELKLKNVQLFPDPAFVLTPEKCDLPDYFNIKKCCGINLSNFVGQNVGFETMFGKNIIKLFDYIIDSTDLDIVLIPHVFWKGQDDRIICNDLYNRYQNTKRVHLLDSEKMNYCQIRYAISKCNYFIGARTHAMISAYSCAIPALALGYSIKSRGIAKDLGLDSDLVINCKSLTDEYQLTNSFKLLIDSKSKIDLVYKNNLQLYIQKAYKARESLNKVMGD